MRGIKENDEGANSSTTYLIYCKNFCGCHNVPPSSTTEKKIPQNNFLKKKPRCSTMH
jgi:hypothetical protein